VEGDLREFPLAEILQFISLGSRSGVLEIERRDTLCSVHFTEGMITGLRANDWSVTRELRDARLLPRSMVGEAIEQTEDVGELRSSLVAGGILTAEEWTIFVARQVERLLYSLFDVREGQFRFRQTPNPPGPWFPVRVSADRAVLEGTRWSETWSRVAERVPSRLLPFVRAAPPAAATSVTPTQWRVYVVLDEPGDVRQIATRAILTEVETVEAIDALLGAGLIRQAPRAV